MSRGFSLEEKLFLAMANHGRAHLLGMDPDRTEEDMSNCVKAIERELGHPLGPVDLCVGHTELPSCPLVQFMVHHGVDHVLGRDTASSEAELMRQAKQYAASLGRPLHDGDVTPVHGQFMTWVLGMR